MKRIHSSVLSGKTPDFTCAWKVGPHRVWAAALTSIA